jgi:hypothetical protein
MFKLFIFTLLICLTSENSYAYLDPGTGGSLIQIIVGMLAAVSSVVVYYWNKIKIFFLGLFKKNNDKENSNKDQSNKS